MTGVLERVESLPAGWVYLTVAVLVFGEDAGLVGFLLPGATAAILGGVTASTGRTNVIAMTVIVIVAAIVGDSLGYEVGHKFGPRLLGVRPMRRRRERLDRARAFLARRGGPAVFLSRFVAFLRAATPFLAGTANMQYRTFLAYNAVAGVFWGVSTVLLGYIAGAAYQVVAARFGEITAITVAVIAIVAVIVHHARRRRSG